MKEIYNGIFSADNNDVVYVIGDIHGDYQCLVHCLVDLCSVTTINKVYDDEEFNTKNREYLSWKKDNNSNVVFCGDLIHRKRFPDVLDDECSDIYILKTLMRLKKEAKNYGGDIIIISGNHEIMNILYPEDASYTSNKNLETNKKYFTNITFVNKLIKNTYAFIKINDTLIAHGGLCSDYLDYLDKFIVDSQLNNKNIAKHDFNKDSEQGSQSNKNIDTQQNKLVFKLLNDKITNLQKHNITESTHNHTENIIPQKSSYIMIGGTRLKYGNDIVKFINDKYKKYFTDFKKENFMEDKISFNLFINYDIDKPKKHNLFWCRQWGYDSDCNEIKNILNKVKCDKMIIAHCPQFLTPEQPKMINFSCKINNQDNYSVARVDLGMSRGFDNNSKSNFIDYLKYNYNRKISVLKIISNDNTFVFNYKCIVTNKLSCLQYLLIKYGISKKKWKKNGIDSNWLGFDLLKKFIKDSKNNKNYKIPENCINDQNSVICLLYPIMLNKILFDSVKQYKSLK